jgi:hypothetical protein
VPHLTADINLEKALAGKQTATVDAGGGVSPALTAVDGMVRQNLVILADGKKLKELAGGRFMACARVDADPVAYWAISEFTGTATGNRENSGRAALLNATGLSLTTARGVENIHYGK